MQTQRPTGVLIFAILHLLFGLTGVIGIIVSEVLLAGAANAENPLIAAVPRTAAYIAVTVGDLLLKMLLVVAGWGLLRMKPMARTASLAYAFLAILLSIGKAWFIYVPIAAGVVDPNAQDIGLIVGVIAGVLMVGLSSIYPLAILIYFSLSSVKQKFRAGRIADSTS